MKNENQKPDQLYTNDFVSFIALCLQKNPHNRPTASELCTTSFIKCNSNREILVNLIRRTKEAVKEFDNIRYRRMKKVLMAKEDPNASNTNISPSNDCIDIDNSSNTQNDILDDPTLDDDDDYDDGQSIGSVPRTSGIDIEDDDSSNFSRSSRQQPLSTIFKGVILNQQSATTAQQINNPVYTGLPVNVSQDNRYVSSTDMPSIVNGNPSQTIQNNMNEFNVDIRIKPKNSEPLSSSNRHPLSAKEFSTIKTAHIVIREQLEHTQDEQQFEQLRGYRQMRHLHQKQLKQFEERCRNEKIELRSKLEREYNVFQEQINFENNRLLEKHRKELADQVKYNQNSLRSLERQQENDFESELKRFNQDQAKKYKSKKEEIKKQVFNASVLSKTEKEDEIRRLKEELQLKQRHEEQNLRAQLIHKFNKRRLQLKRQKLLILQALEKNLFEEKSTKSLDVIVQRHGLLKKHHEQTKEVELKQLANLHKMRNDFSQKQHQTELMNFNEYSNRRQKELTKRHTLNQKQFPKNIKIKQAEIKRQYKDAYNIQSQQYRTLKEKIRSEYTSAMANYSREDLDSKLKSLKEEQRKKLDTLYIRFEEAVQKMFDQQNVKLNSDQERERISLQTTLDDDYQNLVQLQEESRRRMERQHSEERRQLDRNIEERLRKLNEQMEHELTEHNEDRLRQLSSLVEKQGHELSQLDSEMIKLGINVTDLTDNIQDIHSFTANTLFPHDRQILSMSSRSNIRASMISLSHSHSANSFISNTTNGSGTTTMQK